MLSTSNGTNTRNPAAAASTSPAAMPSTDSGVKAGTDAIMTGAGGKGKTDPVGRLPSLRPDRDDATRPVARRASHNRAVATFGPIFDASSTGRQQAPRRVALTIRD